MHTHTNSNRNTGMPLPEIAFTSCEVLDAVHARALAQARAAAKKKTRAKPSGRRIVKVGGRRVKTIDIHAHCVIPETLALCGRNLADQRGPGIDEVGPNRIREMDAQGIDIEALSINPFWYKADRDVAA